MENPPKLNRVIGSWILLWKTSLRTLMQGIGIGSTARRAVLSGCVLPRIRSILLCGKRMRRSCGKSSRTST
ncbi:hypothetical protein RHGRI_001112 [Rhododendron griersonianum]|uniref:Uncharacterized protein n=1 Tax=Rhododendron griersonianum TaxID=479676 RepID=A0AAV6LLV6_9ERIC|nr:hypothetical protein RHGRI_001112 [Rhododendron griersonianum]